MIQKYEIGLPCMFGKVVGRIVGESDNGSWGNINGQEVFSIPLFSTPHGSVIKIGVMHLSDITKEGMSKLKEYEDDAKSKGKKLYAEKLKEKK